jgi:HAD superfamily hydrolase (TIGR01549 family)
MAPPGSAAFDVVVFDLDGTLLDSDEALIDPFVRLGVPRDEISFGHPIEVECTRLGLDVGDYIRHYDTGAALPFAGVDELIATLGRWSVCSNKAAPSAITELARLGWDPEVAMFADDFGGAAKELGPVIERLKVDPVTVLFVGDTVHDYACALEAGTGFRWAGWNPRVDSSVDVLTQPAGVLELLG